MSSVSGDTVSQPVKQDKSNSGDTVTEEKIKFAETLDVAHSGYATVKEPSVNNWHQNSAPVALPIIPIPDILRAVPPMKAVFVSRLTTSTTEDALKHYIVAKLSYPDPDDIVVRKIYNKQRRKISSFKVLAPDLIYNRILSPEFWPDHIVVHEFQKKHDLKTNNL